MLESSTEKEISLSSLRTCGKSKSLSGSRNMWWKIDREGRAFSSLFLRMPGFIDVQRFCFRLLPPPSPPPPPPLRPHEISPILIFIVCTLGLSRRSDPPVQTIPMRILSMRSKARGIPSHMADQYVGLQQSVIDLITVIKYNKRRWVGSSEVGEGGTAEVGLVYWQLKKQGLMRFEEQIEPVRRSVSMDLSAASEIYLAMANAVPVEHEGTSDMRSVPGKKLNLEIVARQSCRNSSLYKLMKSSSIGCSLHRGPLSMKKSLSSFPMFSSRRSRSRDSILPCEDEALTLLLL
ncbi:hypothetical protein CK203_113883 [Vitis vinifera]|uniref:Uncharacterized protein n=1 Tax=Vitis vinifera TaxID=29760 RepID=A0A438FC69_VITVI|nr:hypothetical protein CK203_113883 [Vitis vinifera]